MFGRLLTWFRQYFFIDNLGKGIASKLMFLFLAGSFMLIAFMPPEYSDFTALSDWALTVMEADEITDDMMVAPISTQNVIYLMLGFAVINLAVMTGMLYSGLVVRHIRKKIDGALIITPGRFSGRFIILCIVFSLVSFPLLFIAVYLLLLFVLAVPFLLSIPPCYLSGDQGFWDALFGSVKRMKGRYLSNLRDITGVYVVYLIIGLIAELVSLVSSTAFIVINSFLASWIILTISRVAGINYATSRIGVVNKHK